MRFVLGRISALVAAMMAASVVSGCHIPGHKIFAERVPPPDRRSNVTRSTRQPATPGRQARGREASTAY